MALSSSLGEYNQKVAVLFNAIADKILTLALRRTSSQRTSESPCGDGIDFLLRHLPEAAATHVGACNPKVSAQFAALN